ncbi:MAG: TatD family hydrolase [Minisyncoccota bacterium]
MDSFIPEFFDVHAHINDVQFDGDRIQTIKRMGEERVAAIIVGTDRRSSQLSCQMAPFYENLYAAAGIHPTDNPEEIFREEYFRELLSAPRTVAMGECGLDYLRADADDADERARQKKLFEAQLELAVSCDKPLMIHCRNAHQDMLEILVSKKSVYGDRLRGAVHFFTANQDIARRYLEIGFFISFSGVVTFAREYDDAIRFAPLDRILSETDCPYVAPVPYRGSRNEPVYVKEVVKQLALVRGEEVDTVRRATVANATQLFLSSRVQPV